MPQGPHRTDIVTSRHNALVTRCRMLARSGGAESREMLLDGPHLVEEAMRAGVSVKMAMVDAAVASSSDPPAWLHALTESGDTVVRATSSVMAAISPSRGGTVVAIAARPDIAWPDWLSQADRAVLVACDVQEPGNVGALVRVAHAAGFDGVVAAGTTADPWSWKALRGSMGSTLHLPVTVERDTTCVLSALRARSIRIIASAPRDGRAVLDVNASPPLALLVGAEGSGMSASVLAAADDIVGVPMAAGVDSLNVAVAAGILAYEIRRHWSAEA